jgi:hypothetical protein
MPLQNWVSKRQNMNWTKFVEEWGRQLEDARHILRYLDSCPDVLSGLKMGEVLDEMDMDSSQEDWVRLCTRFDHPMEQEFFKPWWVPVTKDEYDYFIDLSDKRFPVFNIHFYFLEPYGWSREVVVEDISVILLAEDSGVDLQRIVEKNEQEMWTSISGMFDKRMKLVFEGKLEVKALERHEVWLEEDDEPGIVIPPLATDNKVTLPGVRALAVGLLPYTMPVSLVHLDKDNGDICRHSADVRTIRDLVGLIRHEGLLRVEAYLVEFPDLAEGSIEFKEDQLVIKHPAQGVLDRFLDKLEKMKERCV